MFYHIYHYLISVWLPRVESTPKYPDAEGVDSAVALTLRKDYLQQLRSEEPETEITLADIYVQGYYGTYSGCEIVQMDSPLWQNVTADCRTIVGGYMIHFTSDSEPYVHKDDSFTSSKKPMRQVILQKRI